MMTLDCFCYFLLFFSFFFSCSDAFRLSSLRGYQRLSPSSSSCLFARHRIPFVGGNWKSNGTTESVKDLVNLLNDKMPAEEGQHVEVVVAPPFVHLGYVRDNLRSSVAQVSSQDVAVHKGYGAFTGEQSADMIKDFGIPWTLTGHSERRKGFGLAGETNQLVAAKTKTALDQGLKVIACVGEDLVDRENGRTMAVVSGQLNVRLGDLYIYSV
eukprot:GHVS01097077.1.p1 GENE.GHVS01097077.1~~GHVS01097077.1.p1  ORF type:complete len:212 (+),score=40.80 GHVS01097077.1:35-670(+)